MDKQDQLNEFTLYELHWLIRVFDHERLVGLPDLEELELTLNDSWELVRDGLIKKQVITEDLEFTRSGMELLTILKAYCEAHSLVILCNWFIRFTKDKQYALILVYSDKGNYQVIKTHRMAVIQHFITMFPQLFLREPQLEELDFLQTTPTVQTSFEDLYHANDTLYVFDVSSSHPQAWLFNVYHDELIGYEFDTEQMYRVSQYYFLRKIYILLNIPFREGEDRIANHRR